MVVVSFFILNSVFFTLNPVFYPKLSFSQSDQNLRRRSVWSHNAEKTSQPDTFCIYSVYILYIFCTYLPPHHDLGGTQQSIIRTPRSRCGLEIRLPIPLKRAEARLCLSRFITFAVQKNCTGLNPAYQSAEARFCSIRLQKSCNM